MSDKILEFEVGEVNYLPLTEVTKLITDGKHGDCKNEGNSGYYFLSSKDLRGGKLHYDKPRQINFKEFSETHRRTNLEAGDILLTNTGASIGRVGIAQNDPRITQTTFQKSVSVIKADRSKIDNRYLYYFLLNNSELLISLGNGAAQPNLLLGDIRKIEVRVPEISVQQRISEILSNYDYLIENNSRRISILEDLAQTLYREWFVSFRFPGYENCQFKDSPLGQIPWGWEVKKLAEIAKINPESITKKNAPDYIRYVDIKSVNTGSIEGIKVMDFDNAPSRARRKVQNGDVIWATVRPNRKQYSFISKPQENTIVSTGFAVLRAEKVSPEYLYYAVTTDDFATYLVNHATGSAYPAVNSSVFENADILCPSPKLLEKFDALVSNCISESQVLKSKNTNLKKQRDMLLPKLISGNIGI
jgi:type I restriction enzyme, S subunit